MAENSHTKPSPCHFALPQPATVTFLVYQKETSHTTLGSALKDLGKPATMFLRGLTIGLCMEIKACSTFLQAVKHLKAVFLSLSLHQQHIKRKKSGFWKPRYKGRCTKPISVKQLVNSYTCGHMGHMLPPLGPKVPPPPPAPCCGQRYVQQGRKR
jgi:hypothetical protein